MKKIPIIVLTLIVLLVPVYCDNAQARGLLRVAFLDVGQGDAIYIEAPNGNQILIDGGPGNALLPALSEVMPFGDRSINVLVVTNPDTDHYSGFINLLKSYEVGAVVQPGTRTATTTYAKFRADIASHGITEVRAWRGMRIDIDRENGVVFEVLFPDRDVSSWSPNDGSLAGILTYGMTKIFFTGDGSQRTEGLVLSGNPSSMLRSDILKVGHHGSRTSTGATFLRAVAPEYAVISAGDENKYGHPHQEVLKTLVESGTTVLRTDMLGTIIFTSDGDSFIFER